MAKVLLTKKILIVFIFFIIVSFGAGYIISAYQSYLYYDNLVRIISAQIRNLDLSQAIRQACSPDNYNVSFDSFNYCNGTLTGRVTNNGNMGLWIFSLDVYYPGPYVRKIFLTPQLGVGQSYYFVATNVSKGYGEMVLQTNCTYSGQEIAPDRITTC